MGIILIVDDQQANRAFLKTLLACQHHHFLEASRVSESLAIIHSVRPDLVISDIVLPEVDGFEFVRRIRAIPEIAHTRVIFYSANAIDAATQDLATSCGIKAIIDKTTEPEEILANVAATLSESLPPLSIRADIADPMHQRLLIDTLANKVHELETLNAGLERRVNERTNELAAAHTHLRELNTFKDNLVAVAAHDLRSPLSIIQSIATMVLDDHETPAPTKRLVQIMLDSAHQLSTFVADILDISSLEAGKISLDLAPLQVGFVTQQVIESLQASAKLKQITLNFELPSEQFTILADWRRVAQVISNLIVNALKFTPRGGWVSVTVRPDAGMICVDVCDSGIGIPPESIPQIFEKFYRVHTIGTANERGSGLGLAIVQQIVALHGGSIEVTSHVGRGSQFTVHLPVIPPKLMTQ